MILDDLLSNTSAKKFEKLKIEYETNKGSFKGTLEAQFNPSQLSFSSSATWDRLESAAKSKSAAVVRTVFRSTTPETLTITLFFDTYAPYESGAAGGVLGLLSGSAPAPQSVVTLTTKVLDLGRINQEMHRPPVCKLSWGNGWQAGTLFQGILERASCTYLLFLDDGTPVRATMECGFKAVSPEVLAPDEALPKELHSADVAKRYMVRPGDTIMSIASAFYGDGSLWRVIADANGIEDPRSITPGRSLAVPRIR